MKRLLPVVVVLCLIGTIFTCLPKSESNDVTITCVDDLNGKSVGIQSGAGYELYLEERCPEATPVFFNEFSSIYPALTQGKIDVMISENIAFAVEKTEIPSLVAIEEPIATLDYSVGVSKAGNNNNVYAELNEYIAKSKEDKTIDELKAYWFDNYDRDNATVDKSGINNENKTLVFACEASFEPVCFAGKGGELSGFGVDFIYHFCREYGYVPQIECLEYDSMIAALASGKITVAFGIIPDDERKEEVNFTDPIMDFEVLAVYDNGQSSNTSFFDNFVNSFAKTFIRDDRWKMFLEGVDNTFKISLLSVTFGTILGLLLYIWVDHGKKAEKFFVSIISWLASSTPSVVMLMILYYIIFGQYLVDNVSVAITGFSIVFGCGFYERIVAGVKAVGVGQFEAAYSQGFNKDQTFFRIIFPQAARHFMGAYEGDIIALIQETSVVGYIAIKDLTKMSDLVRARTYEAFFPLLATACMYFLLIWVLTKLFGTIANIFYNKNRKKQYILRGIKTKD